MSEGLIREQFGDGYIRKWCYAATSLSGPFPPEVLMAHTNFIMYEMPDDAYIGIIEPRNVHDIAHDTDVVVTTVTYISGVPPTT